MVPISRNEEEMFKRKFVSKRMLISLIKRLDNEKTPIAVKEDKDSNLIIELKVNEVKWSGMFGSSWRNKRYQAYVNIDEYRREVRFFDIIKQVEFTAGSFERFEEKFFTKGTIIDTKEQSRLLALRPDLSIEEIYKYQFDPEIIRNVIKRICNDNGWDFKRVLFR